VSDFDDLRQIREAKEKAEKAEVLVQQRKLDEERQRAEAAYTELIALAQSLHNTVVSVLEDYRKATSPNRQLVVTPQSASVSYVPTWTIGEPDYDPDWHGLRLVEVTLRRSQDDEHHLEVTGWVYGVRKSIICEPTRDELVYALKELYLSQLSAQSERKL
jgi:hypothetical protein